LWLWFTVTLEFKDLGGNFDQQQVEDMGFGRLRHKEGIPPGGSLEVFVRVDHFHGIWSFNSGMEL